MADSDATGPRPLVPVSDPLPDGPKQAHYLRTIDDSPIGMFRLDTNGRIVDANKKLLDLLGYEWAQIQGKGFNEITHPDDRWIGLEVLIELRAGRIHNAAYEKRFLTQDGRAVWAAVAASAITVDGRLSGIVVMVTDLTLRPSADELAESENGLLKGVLSVAPIVVFATDAEGVLILCEGRGLVMPGDARDPVGRPVWDVFGDAVVVKAQISLGLAGGVGQFAMRFGDAAFECRYRPIQSLEGIVLGVTGVAQDVSALAAVTNENTRLSQSMTSLTHEIRNPLNVILGFTELLVNGHYGALADRQKVPLSRIQLGGRQLLSLVNDVLDLAKVKAGWIQLDDVELEAGAVVHAAYLEMSVMAGSKKVRLVEVPGPSVNFRADSRRVHQVLLNLLSNAIKFTPAGGTVSLGVEVSPEGGPRISVSDTGAGLTAEEIQVIFEEFVQVSADRHVTPQGTGLGLPISRRLATLMGGTLVAESTVGEGSRFFLTLPRMRLLAGRSAKHQLPVGATNGAEVLAEHESPAATADGELDARDVGDVYTDEPWLSIRWDAEHECIYAEFKSFASSSQFRASAIKILDAVWDRQATSLVSDHRGLAGIAQNDQLWLRDTWFALALAAGVKRIAVVLGETGPGGIASEDIIRTFGRKVLALSTFDSVMAANQWIGESIVAASA